MATDQTWTKVHSNGPIPECPQYDATDKTFERIGTSVLEDAEHAVTRSARNAPTEFTRRAPWHTKAQG